jgi:hypothetical protein
MVDVKEAGSLNPIGTPDFATAFTNEPTVVKPLDNDLSPSGAQLGLIGMDAVGGSAAASLNPDRGEITFSSTSPGINYLKYTVQAGAKTSVGLIRIDVKDKPVDTKLPPVAVKDTAYLRGDEPATVAVLGNDVSPQGKILAVQSVQVPPEFAAKGFVAELLASTKVRITSPQALTEQVNFTYTISDGLTSATAGVTVVPVPALTKHQPPVAANDVAKVRVGDVVTLDVLSNDFHPDNSLMTLDKKLITPPADGLAFVAKNKLRFQAPEQPGEYRVDYRVLDPFGETAAASATFTVTPMNTKANQDPVPQSLVGRVLAGGSIRIDVPLEGIDPDGDSSQLLNFPTSATLGSVSETGPNYFIYDAAPGATGTDEFDYQVYDAFGATGTAKVRIAVIPRPSELSNPSALPDSVSIRPGRIAQVDLLANDSDPQGAPIKVSKKLIDVPEGIDAEVVRGQYLVVTAPDSVQSFSMRYELTNDSGGKTLSYALVKVDPNAPILPPTAEDVPILTKDVAGKKTITVDIFDGYAFNPSGITEDMVVTVEGPNAKSAQVLDENGKIEVTPGETRQAVAYRVTNKADNLNAMAFLLVPEAVTEEFDDPPRIDPNLPVQYVSMNESREWKLSEILEVPSGRDAYIYDKTTVSNVQSDGTSSYLDKETVKFTPARDYRGPASISFSVSDGSSANDPKGNRADLRLPIVVGDPEFRDTPPEFTTPNVQVEVGEKSTLDLRESTGHPNPQILQQVTYSNITGTSAGLSANLSGSQLEISVPRNAKKGSTYTLGVTLRWDKFTVEGTINVLVVGSTRPLAVAVTDTYESQRGDPATVANPLTNDSNPYQTTGEKLKIVDVVVSNTGQPATISHTDNTVTISPNPSLKDGRIEVTYTIEDATEDADRRVNGTIVLVVSDVPDKVTPAPVSYTGSNVGGDSEASWVFTAPASNGKPITSYDVRVQGGSANAKTGCTAGGECKITGLTNGTAYQFSARAVNEHGAGDWSDWSAQITPYGTPSTPAVILAVNDPWAAGEIQGSWPQVNGGGSSVTYYWSTAGRSGTTGGLTTGPISGLPAGSYTISVYAVNAGNKQSATGTSGGGQIQNQTVPGAVPVTRTVLDGDAPDGQVRWNWSSPGGGAAVTANMQYERRLNNGSWVAVNGETQFTSNDNLGEGDYTLFVRAKNKAGTGPAGDATGHVGPNPKNPRVAVAWGANAVGEPNCSHSSCHWVKINAYDLANNTTYTASNSECGSKSFTTNGNGNGSVQFDCYYGYPDNNVTVSAGGESDTRLWKNAE